MSMPNVSNSSRQDRSADCPPVTAAPAARDIDDYTASMLRALERLAQTNRHDVLAKLLRLACAEAKHIRARHNPVAPDSAGPARRTPG